MAKIRMAVKALIRKDNKILVLQRANTGDKIEWDIPGGGIEEGETFEQALAREVREETGLVVEITDIVRLWTCVDEGQMLYGVTFATIYQSGDVVLSDEHQAYDWIEIDNINNTDVAKWIKAEVAIMKNKLKA